MQIEKLIEEQKKRFEKEFTYGVLLSASSDLSAGEDIRFRRDYHPNIIFDWYKQSLKQFIDGLVEREEGRLSNQKRDNGHECYDHNCESCENAIKDSVIEETVSHLKEIRKQLELEVVDN